MASTVEELRAEYPELTAQLEAEARAAATPAPSAAAEGDGGADPAQAERQRIQDIDALASLYDAESIREAKYGDHPCTAQELAYRMAQKAAQTGKSDMVMAGVTVDEDRLAVMDFSNSYATGVQVIIVKEGSDVTLDNLGEQLIGVQNGTTGWQYCTDDFGSEHVAAFDNGITAVQALMNDQVDCVVIDQAPAQSFVEQNPGLTILDTEYAVEDYAIGVAKGNTSLLNAINTVLEELQADGTIQSIIDKYIPAE